MTDRSAIMAGATGLTGTLIADRLLASGSEVHAVVRHHSGRSDPAWHEHVAPPPHWPKIVSAIPVEAAVSALGTTMRKAGSEAGFRAIDHDLVLEFARAARAAGARHMIALSSVGADPASRNFYLRLKGEVDEALGRIGFQRLDILRPGLLRGPRGAERRLGERLGILVSPLVNLLLRGRLDRYAAIDAAAVAAAAAALLDERESGIFVHHNRDLHRLARS